jgi:hypothetical protein
VELGVTLKRCERRESRARRAELGWGAAVLDERASRHVLRLRTSEEGSGLTSASLSERSEQCTRSEQRRFALRATDPKRASEASTSPSGEL